MNDVITLIGQSGAANAVGDKAPSGGEERRTVFAQVKSVGASYKIKALAAGLRPKWRFLLADYLEYRGEERVEYEGKPYRVIDTYRGEDHTLELTVEDLP